MAEERWYQAFLDYISTQRRYSERTIGSYSFVLERFVSFAGDGVEFLNPTVLRSFEVHLMEDLALGPRSVNMYLSVLSACCRYLVKREVLSFNPVRLIPKPRTPKRLPEFFREDSMREYFAATDYFVSAEALEILSQTRDSRLYSRLLGRVMISILYGTAIRRSELVSLRRSDFDPFRSVIHVHGKGDKMRDVPLTDTLKDEIRNYLRAGESFFGSESETLLRTPNGGKLYPVFVDRTVKSELGGVESATSKKSPHVLRHTLASSLLSDGADLNSIKELLGHSSLAATQVYTHSSVDRLLEVYRKAHPRSEKED